MIRSVSIASAVAIVFAIAIAPVLAQDSTPATRSATASAAPTGVATAAPKPAAASSAASLPALTGALPHEAREVISYLSDVINWYGHLGTEAQLVRDPDETLFFADDRQTASEILKLAFEFARTQATYLARTTATGANAAGSPALPGAAAPGAAATVPPTPELDKVTHTLKTLEADAGRLSARIKELQAQLAKASASKRAAISAQIDGAQNELDLNRARLDALTSLAQFESGSASQDQSGTLSGRIDELEHSISDSGKKMLALPADIGLLAKTEPTGIPSLISDMFALNSKLDALEQNVELAQALSTRATGVRKSILSTITALDGRGNALAQGAGGNDVAALKDRKKAFDSLLQEHKLLSASALPLSKQIVLLGIYVNNVGRWHDAVAMRWKKDLRSLFVRLLALAVSFGLIFVVALAWRWLTNRYVTDTRRRGQVMAARRLAIGLLVLIVLLINFSDELGSAATVVGFAAAGIAVALQNVILSIAGYFFLIGRFGIKVGDRVQIGGVTGDVIDIGLVKLSLMELGGSGTHREPTGRVAVFSNAIVFQPSGNFFKQAPGTSFVWNEVRLTLAPDIDYRLAEKRLMGAVDEVFARYRDRVMRDYRHLERDLNIMLETPKPQSRIHLSQSGLEIVIRYPAEIYSAPQITDEISRRVLDAISHEPSLRMAPQATANIQSQAPLPPTVEETDQPTEADEKAPDEKAPDNNPVDDKPLATAAADKSTDASRTIK